MKLQVLALVAAVAATARAQFNEQSKAFGLKLQSADDQLNNKWLYACHSGAGEEVICVGDAMMPNATSNAHSFYHNTSSSVYQGNPMGWLTWNLIFYMDGSSRIVNNPVQLQFNPVSNVALPSISVSEAFGFLTVFDQQNKLAGLSYGDDSVNGATRPRTRQLAAYMNWHVCYAFAGSYYYRVLTWVTSGVPHNPSCVKVDVVRHFL